jgi:hypothetical protein
MIETWRPSPPWRGELHRNGLLPSAKNLAVHPTVHEAVKMFAARKGLSIRAWVESALWRALKAEGADDETLYWLVNGLETEYQRQTQPGG